MSRFQSIILVVCLFFVIVFVIVYRRRHRFLGPKLHHYLHNNGIPKQKSSTSRIGKTSFARTHLTRNFIFIVHANLAKRSSRDTKSFAREQSNRTGREISRNLICPHFYKKQRIFAQKQPRKHRQKHAKNTAKKAIFARKNAKKWRAAAKAPPHPPPGRVITAPQLRVLLIMFTGLICLITCKVRSACACAYPADDGEKLFNYSVIQLK